MYYNIYNMFNIAVSEMNMAVNVINETENKIK